MHIYIPLIFLKQLDARLSLQRMKPQIWPKNMIRILVSLDPLHHHQRTSLLMANSRRLLQNSENSKELLLNATDLSRGKAKVPRGFLAVYVGPELRRFLIPAKYLSMPDFKELMERAEEEFGFQQEGGLRIPCEEEDFEEILSRCGEKQRRISQSHSKRKGKRLLAVASITISS